MKLQEPDNLHDGRVVRQSHPRSCGAAALATLLRANLGRSETESDLLRRLGTRGAVDMNSLRRCAESLGLRAHGYALDPENLQRVGRPAILHLQGSDQVGHFVVLRGMGGGSVRLADPARGDRLLVMPHFQALWLSRQAKGEGRALYVDARDSSWLPLTSAEDLPGPPPGALPLDWFPPV